LSSKNRIFFKSFVFKGLRASQATAVKQKTEKMKNQTIYSLPRMLAER
jgi:hypothetical protein